jgi:hypothetical protein
MSKAILEQLEQLDAVLRVSGMPWLKAGQTLDTSVASLTAKILCQRHNEALSPLDTEAARFFYILREAVDDLKRKTLSLKPILHLVDGAALELWMVKVACGLYYSGATKDGVKVSNTHRINLEKARRALFQRDWDARAGLYFVESGNKVAVQDSVAMAPITADNDSIFVGANVSLLGFTMGALFDDSKTIPLPWPGFKRRPSEFILIKNRRQHTIFLASWPPGTEWASVGYRWHHGLQWG